jgi:hypothetical protein
MAMKSSNSHERLDVRQPAGKLAFIFQIIFQVTCLKIKFGQIYCAFISYPNGSLKAISLFSFGTFKEHLSLSRIRT